MATILCIDDRTHAFASRIGLLRTHGHTVLSAANQSTAINLLGGNNIDVLIVDCHMDGIEELLLAVRTLRPSLPTIMLSGYCGVPCKVSREADACLQKGETGATLLKTVEGVMRSARYGSCRAIPIRSAA